MFFCTSVSSLYLGVPLTPADCPCCVTESSNHSLGKRSVSTHSYTSTELPGNCCPQFVFLYSVSPCSYHM